MNMEENMEIYRKPVFTKQWFCVRVLLVTGLSLFMTIVACGFDALALGRKEEFLLKTLLIGSLSIFVLLSLSMFLSLRLKVENNELLFKKL